MAFVIWGISMTVANFYLQLHFYVRRGIELSPIRYTQVMMFRIVGIGRSGLKDEYMLADVSSLHMVFIQVNNLLLFFKCTCVCCVQYKGFGKLHLKANNGFLFFAPLYTIHEDVCIQRQFNIIARVRLIVKRSSYSHTRHGYPCLPLSRHIIFIVMAIYFVQLAREYMLICV